MGHAARGEVYIPLEDWTNFVRAYLPNTDGNILIGPPLGTVDGIEVPFAINTECSPRDEIDPPEWAKPKK